jgi:hypothetical protein
VVFGVDIWVHGSKGKNGLIEDDVAINIDTIGGSI